jgi:hypothetical protein
MCSHRRSGKAVSIAYSECVSVALGIQHAMRMRRVTMPSVAWPTLQNFYSLYHKRHDLRKKRYWTQNVCFDFLYNFCLQHFCTTSVRNISVQLLSATFLYNFCPQHFCTTSVCNISVQLLSATFLYNFCLKHFCTTSVWNISVQLLSEHFCTTSVCNISHPKKNAARYYHKWTHHFTYCTSYSCQALTKLHFSLQIFEKETSNTKFHENSSNGSRVVPYWRKDRHIFSRGASARFRAMASPYQDLTIILTHTATGRNPVDECSARRRGLYLITHQIQHSQQTNIRPQAKFEPAIPAQASGRRTTP